MPYPNSSSPLTRTRLTNFLPLAPTVSDSYPRRPSQPTTVTTARGMTFLSLAPTVSEAPGTPSRRASEPVASGGFLSLAPTTSEPAFPRRPSQPIPPTNFLPLAPTVSEPYLPADAITTKRRTSSISSTSSTISSGSNGRVRFLKLGPVYWGEADDFSEVAVE
ncbi:hypothetical protein VTJ04DRAFT_1516 [Mycothermus thermophilus]|uniref:uncharacterized protein n=1 Tax=Humicola insolens TaxID=85995 RepID=UPI00374222AF